MKQKESKLSKTKRLNKTNKPYRRSKKKQREASGGTEGSSGSDGGSKRQAPSADESTRVLVTATGLKYHKRKCGNGTYTEATLAEAKSRGLTPCSKCY
ncbi:hypothetical protein MFLO_07367 [Listeria floridensis FSL S10-1187]|uniref:Uncharacterized protein n=1 Tax=Listeria floridensis FSL S10-1187 TaxID=1265817 RepID=A0ABP3AZU7_9LIST|nr:hypothetical protein MFLO_07367 [Listeria floridensis FSL S10-1187]